MALAGDIAGTLLIAAEEEGGSFLVSPSLGLMIWTLLLFATFAVLSKYVFPRITEALDRRRLTIEKSLDDAAVSKREADELLAEYRARLREAREQAGGHQTARARKAADSLADEAKADATECARS